MQTKSLYLLIPLLYLGLGLGILIYLSRHLDQETAKEPFQHSSQAAKVIVLFVVYC